MKKQIKFISAVLAALTVASSVAASSSVFAANGVDGGIFKGGTVGSGKPVSSTAVETEKQEEKPLTVYVEKTAEYECSYSCRYCCTSYGCRYSHAPVYNCYKHSHTYTYYSSSDAYDYVKEYFDTNSYTFDIVRGQIREFNPELYYVSEDPDIAYYDDAKGAVVAVKKGNTSIYVYSAGGVPLYRLKVNVTTGVYAFPPTRLVLDAADWNLEVGDKTTLTVKATDGKTYDDIVFKAVYDGYKYCTVDAETGVIKAEKNGPVVIRAYRETNPDVYGDMLIYIGSVKNALLEGSYTIKDGCLKVDKWFDGCFDYSRYYYDIIGWVKGDCGTLIPVIKRSNARIVTLKHGLVTYGELLYYAYADKVDEDTLDWLNKYYFLKYGSCYKSSYCDADDYRSFFYINTLEDFIAKH